MSCVVRRVKRTTAARGGAKMPKRVHSTRSIEVFYSGIFFWYRTPSNSMPVLTVKTYSSIVSQENGGPSGDWLRVAETRILRNDPPCSIPALPRCSPLRLLLFGNLHATVLGDKLLGVVCARYYRPTLCSVGMRSS